MWEFLFVDNETGEQFFVETDTFDSAMETAKTWFDEPKFCDVFTPYEADVLGYDTY